MHLNKAKQNEHNIADINTRNQWIQGTNIHNTGLPNYTKGSWNCSYNRLSGLLNISGQIELSQGSTIAGETRIATIPENIVKLLNPSGERKIWSSIFVTRADNTLEVQNLTIDQTGKIYMLYPMSNVKYMNCQLTLNTSTWSL